MEFFLDIFSNLVSQFTNPKKRVFVLYLLLSVLIAFVWLVFNKKKSFKGSLKFIFNRQIFFSKSAKSDYKVFVINQVIMLLISPHLLTQMTIATALYLFFFNIEIFQIGYFSYVPQYLIVILFTFFHFLADDFSKYIVHRWMHRWPFLWALHKVHHSATNLTPMTVFRTHPLEGLVFTIRSAVTQGFVISTFVYFFGAGVDLYTILGANLFIFLFNVFGSNLRHYNKNYGATLAIWDWLFNSLHHSEETENLTLGLGSKDDQKKHTLIELYQTPLLEIYRYFKKRIFLIFQAIKKHKTKSEIYSKKSLL